MTLLSICIGEENMQNSIIANPGTVGEEYIRVHVYIEFLRMSPELP